MRLNQVFCIKAKASTLKEDSSSPPAAPSKSLPPGIVANWWFWVSRLDVTKGSDGDEKGKASAASSERTSDQNPDKSRQDQPIKKVSAPTPPAGKDAPAKVETDAASSIPQVARAGLKKESTGGLRFAGRFLELSKGGAAPAAAVKPSDKNGTRFRCILIQEGLGNFGDAFYYSREALESAVPLFEGKKIYANHPSAIDDQVRPERDVRDILGHFADVSLVEGEAGQSHLESDLCIPLGESFDWARDLMLHGLEYSEAYPDKAFIGLSINASGEAEAKPIDDVIAMAPEGSKAKLVQAQSELGLTEVRVVSKIESAVSCDLVTEAGAGGAILSLLEQERIMKKKTTAKREADVDAKKVAAQGGIGAQKSAAGDAAESDAVVPGDDGAAAPDAGHDDAAQDVALIKKMIAKHMAKGAAAPANADAAPAAGDNEAEEADAMEGDMAEGELSEAEGAMAKEAYEAYKEMGYSEDAALEAAAHTMKCAKHMQAKKEAAAQEAGDEKDAKADAAAPAEKVEEAKEEECGEPAPKKESMKIAELTGKITLLEGKLKKFELAQTLESMLEKSGIGMAATKSFRAMTQVKEAKSEKELTNLFEAFKAGRGNTGSPAGDGYDFVLSAEKSNLLESGAKMISLSDCKN